MFDLNALKISESTVLHLRHPVTDALLYADKAETKPVTITVGSTASREYRAAAAAMNNRDLKRKKQRKEATADILRDEGIELLTAVCLDSENLVYDGKPVKDEASFRSLLSDDGFSWLKRQVDEALGAVDLFIN